MNDEKRLELMQQMLSRLSGKPVAPSEPATSEPAVEVVPAETDAAKGPSEARLRALKELLDRLGG